MTYYEDEKTRKTIDTLLQQNASLHATIGIDSTKEEKKEIRAKQKVLMDEIKTLDIEFYKNVTADK